MAPLRGHFFKTGDPLPDRLGRCANSKMTRYETPEGWGDVARLEPATCPIMGWCRAHQEGCGDNSSILRTVERLLTTAVKRFVGPICDVAETRAPKPVREGRQRLRHLECLSALLLNSHGEERAGDATTK